MQSPSINLAAGDLCTDIAQNLKRDYEVGYHCKLFAVCALHVGFARWRFANVHMHKMNIKGAC